MLAFLVAAAAIAMLAQLVGSATDQLGGRVGSSAAGVVQSALGNLPELFIALFALNDGLVRVVQSAIVGSVIANAVPVLGVAFLVGGIANGPQRFDYARARIIATLTVLAAVILSLPTLTHTFHTPAAPHDRALSFICAGVLIVLFFVTLRTFLSGDDARGVAIAGNAVENVIGVQLAIRNRVDFAIAVIVSSALQVALLLTPVLVFVSLLFATELSLVFPTLPRSRSSSRPRSWRSWSTTARATARRARS